MKTAIQGKAIPREDVNPRPGLNKLMMDRLQIGAQFRLEILDAGMRIQIVNKFKASFRLSKTSLLVKTIAKCVGYLDFSMLR